MTTCCRTSSSKFKSSLKHGRWLFPLSGLMALLWFLVRVVPKPSRALYPCQRAATPLASGFVAWVFGSLTGLFPSVLAFKQGRKALARARVGIAVVLFAAALGFFTQSIVINAPAGVADDGTASFVPEAGNQPLGVGRGINPGRVTWVYNPDAVNFSVRDYWWSDSNMDQELVNEMMSKTLNWLTGEETDAAAWDALFRSFNISRGNGDVGYQPGQKIAVKLNMNNSDSGDWRTQFCTSPQVTYALVNQLIENAGVPGSAITLYDASRGIGNPVYNKVRSNPAQDYQDIQFVVSPARPGAGRITAVHDTLVAVHFADKEMEDADSTFLPTCVTEAAYLINAGQLKGHSLAGVTLCAKNFFGSLYRPSNSTTSGQMAWTPTGTDVNNEDNIIPDTNPSIGPGMHGIHGYMNPFYVGFWYLGANPMGSYNALVDLMGHDDLGGKVMLFLVDGLYSSTDQGSNVAKWNSAPFNRDWTSSIFASQDIIAIESVCLDFLVNEPTMIYNKGALDNYLHEGAQADNPPSGTFYDPEADGTRLASLGVHEHWNNASDKLYSRNMGADEGIELVRAPFAPQNVVAAAGEGFVDLSWDSCVVTDSYTVKRSDSSDGEYTVIVSDLTEPTFSDTDVTGGETYYYVVTAVNVYDESFNSTVASATPESPVGVETEPAAFSLSLSCFPNPFNSSTRISYSLPEESRVIVQIYNMLGQRVATLMDTQLPAGNHSFVWNGRNDHGESISSGMYLVRLNSMNSSLTNKVVLLY